MPFDPSAFDSEGFETDEESTARPFTRVADATGAWVTSGIGGGVWNNSSNASPNWSTSGTGGGVWNTTTPSSGSWTS